MQINFGFVFGAIVLMVGTSLALVRGNASRILQMVLSVGGFVLVIESFFGYFELKPAFVAPGQLGIFSKEALAGVALIVHGHNDHLDSGSPKFG